MTKKVELKPMVAYTDGACKGNPGGIGGWGVLLTDYVKIQEFFGGEADTTNNRMELMAVIKAVEHSPLDCSLEVFTDSQYVQQGISSWIKGWKARGWKTAAGAPVKNQDLWKHLDALQSRRKIKYSWVKGHNGDPGNERADVLANKGVESVKKDSAK